MKIQFSQKSYEDTGEISLLKDLEKTRSALEVAYLGFDNVTDPDLIDAYIYEVNAVQKRYKYLLSQAAKLNLLPATDSLEENSYSPALCKEPSVSSLVG